MFTNLKRWYTINTKVKESQSQTKNSIIYENNLKEVV